MNDAAIWTQRVRHEWGRWLATFQWDHFLTLTFARDYSDAAADRAIKAWLRRLVVVRLHWFYVIERHAGGTPHVHALIEGTKALGAQGVRRAWRHGRSHVVAYDARKGASHYLSKDLTSAATLYDFHLPRGET